MRPSVIDRSLLAALLLVVLAGCGSAGDGATPAASDTGTATATPSANPTTSPPAPGVEPGQPGSIAASLTLTRTGGLIGYQDMVVISPDGSWIYTDKRNGRIERGQLTAAQLRQILALATDPAFIQEARQAPPNVVCNDGIEYSVSVGELTARYDQCGGASSRPMTDKIVNAVADATPL
jgi:hypothetical protein